MENKILVQEDNHVDDIVDLQISNCLTQDQTKSFFLFAGAGSGKTRSLIQALEAINFVKGESLRIHGQKIGVITFTNNACDEIKRRLKNNVPAYTATIHSFVWDLISGFNTDIKTWLKKHLEEDIAELKQKASRAGTKAETERVYQIVKKEARLAELDSILRFTYNPNSNDIKRDSLNHQEVLELGASFLTEKTIMQQIFIKKFPILLIDESQDTQKNLMEAFLFVQSKYKEKFVLGLFGDTMQRIYSNGKSDLGCDLPTDFERPAKKMNHRSATRIIQFINKIRSESEINAQEQKWRKDKKEGFVRLFIAASNKEKQVIETKVMHRMASITNDSKWEESDSVISLILEHHMAANRMGFGDVFASLYLSPKLLQRFHENSLAEFTFFSDIILPLLEAHQENDKFAIANVAKSKSPFFNKEYIKEHKTNIKEILTKIKTEIDKLCKAYDENPEISFGEILQIVYDSAIFTIPSSYISILEKMNKGSQESITGAIEDAHGLEEETNLEAGALEALLKVKFSQCKPAMLYVTNQSQFYTHQGVKGLEFPRVMSIIDDNEARGFLFSFDKFFGIKEKTKADITNENLGKETSIDRTRRLFYVICSRAEESLAIVAYTSNPLELQTSLQNKGWFEPDEIIIIE